MPLTTVIGWLAPILAIAALMWPETIRAKDARSDIPMAQRLVAAAIERTRHVVTYDGSYQSLSYPGGDVSEDHGVCSDLVTWRLGGRLPHIGLVTDRRSPDGRRPLIVHNIGRSPELEDTLFDHPIVGHFRYMSHE